MSRSAGTKATSPARTPRARPTTISRLPQDSFPPPRAGFRAWPPRTVARRARPRPRAPSPPDGPTAGSQAAAGVASRRSIAGWRTARHNPDCRTVHTRSKRVPPAPSGSCRHRCRPVRPPNPRASRAPAARDRRDDLPPSTAPRRIQTRATDGANPAGTTCMCSRRRALPRAPALCPRNLSPWGRGRRAQRVG